jgi:hypothetical protein
VTMRLSWRQVVGLLAFAVIVAAGIWALPWASARLDDPGTPAAAPAGRAVTPAPRDGDPVVVAAGDIVPTEAGGAHQRTSDQVLKIDPAAVLTLGDLQYPSGELKHFQRYYDTTWGRFKAITRPAPGNHEYETDGASGYFTYFGSAARPKGASYYSYDIGGWHLIALDSNIERGAGSAQEQWLRSDLSATSKKCVLAYWHHPRFSSGKEHGNDDSVDAFWDALYQARADLVLSGHEHNYERFGLQNPDAQADPRGLREFVVGSGGKDLYNFGSPEPNSELRDDDTYGVLKLTLHPSSYDWEFVTDSGIVTDSGGPVACH